MAIAALINLVLLMGAELVAGRHRDDLSQLEQAVRAKIGAVTVVGCSVEMADAGLALARSHVERALTQIRVQADAARAADLKNASSQEQTEAAAPPKPLLN